LRRDENQKTNLLRSIEAPNALPSGGEESVARREEHSAWFRDRMAKG